MQWSSMDDVSEILERSVFRSSSNVLCQASLVTIYNVQRFAVISGHVATHSNTVGHSLQHPCQVHRARLEDKLQDVNRMSITCEFWSNRPAKAFLVLTCCYLSSKFELNNIILDFSSLFR
jgi:hypothetical protein